jgi:hypothetical protein
MTWIDPNGSDFNTIKDGQPVAQATTDPTFDNIKNNLNFLYDKLNTIQEDKSSLVLYGEPLAEDELLSLTIDNYKIGTPVFLYEGAWKPAGIVIDPTETTVSRWGYDLPSFSCGMVLRVYESQGLTFADIILAGDYLFDIYQDEIEGYDLITSTSGNTPLQDVFTDDSFELDGDTLRYKAEFLKSGVYYLSAETGKLSLDTTYTIAIGVIFVVRDGSEFQLRVFIQPEGLAGHRKHQHESVSLAGQIAKRESIDPNVVDTAALPVIWGTDLSGLLPITSLNVGGDNVAYPFEDLVGANPGDTTAEAVLNLYNPTDSVDTAGGWLSAADEYFTNPIAQGGLGLDSEDIPENAVWGYTVNRLDKFNYSWSTINGVFDLSSMILALNGQPVNKNHYIINEYGIWWVQDGYENCPFSTRISYGKEFNIFYVNPVTSSETSSIGSVASDTLLVTKDGSTASMDTLDGFLSIPMVPVMPFNPTLDLQRASKEVAQSGVDDHQILTPMTALELVNNLSALTESSEARTARFYQEGSFDDLTTGGFWRVSNLSSSPAEAPLSYLGMVITAPDAIAQVFIQPESNNAYYRAAVATGETYSWGAWIGLKVGAEDGGNGGGGVPVGSISIWPLETAPEGYILLDGSTYNVVSTPQFGALLAVLGNRYGGDGVSTFSVPDYRGMFIRGWNGSRGDDYADPDKFNRKNRGDGSVGNVVGTTQDQDTKAHTHGGVMRHPAISNTPYVEQRQQGDPDGAWSSFNLDTLSTGGLETRPNNISCSFIIKF